MLEVLCVEAAPAWQEFLEHAQSCGNEYYVLAARMFASLRHSDLTNTPQGTDSADILAPWADYASPPWWETMRRPIYSDSDSDSAADDQSSGSESQSDGFARTACYPLLGPGFEV